jgi:hypothetical protein
MLLGIGELSVFDLFDFSKYLFLCLFSREYLILSCCTLVCLLLTWHCKKSVKLSFICCIVLLNFFLVSSIEVYRVHDHEICRRFLPQSQSSQGNYQHNTVTSIYSLRWTLRWKNKFNFVWWPVWKINLTSTPNLGWCAYNERVFLSCANLYMLRSLK